MPREAICRVAIIALATSFANPLAASSSGPAGSWLAEDIEGGGIVDRLQTTLTLESSGKVSGSGGCNRFHGEAKIAGAAIRFGPLAATRMMCPPAVQAQEARFFAALERARGWAQDDARRRLSLTDDHGRVILRFSAMK